MTTITFAKVVTSNPATPLVASPVTAEALSVDENGRLRTSNGPGGGGSLPAGTDRSGTITTGGTAQQMAPASTSRLSLKGQNVSAGNLGINEIGGTAVIGNAGTYTVPAGAAFSIGTNRAVSVVGPTTGQAWTATES